MDLKIRWATPKDFQQVFGLNKPSTIFTMARFMTSPISIEKTLHSKYIFLVAEMDGKCVGYSLSKLKTKGVCWNVLVSVDPSKRRMGIGKTLVVSTLKLLEKDSMYKSWKCYAEVDGTNYESLGMYKSLGFETDGVLRKHTSGKKDIHIVSFYLDEQKPPELLGLSSELEYDFENHLLSFAQKEKKGLLGL